MITALIIGIIVGIILAMPPGPIGVLSIRMGLRKNVRSAMYVALGSGVSDFLICFGAVAAATALVNALRSLFENHPIVSVILQIVLITAFFAYGFYSLKAKRAECVQIEETDIENCSSFAHHLKENGPFFLGAGLALANLANPTFLPSIGYVAVQVQKFNFYDVTSLNNILYSLGFGIGNFVWLYTLSNIVFKLKEKFSDNFIIRVKQFAGITFISFGGILGWRLLFFTKWADVFRLVVSSI